MTQIRLYAVTHILNRSSSKKLSMVLTLVITENCLTQQYCNAGMYVVVAFISFKKLKINLKFPLAVDGLMQYMIGFSLITHRSSGCLVL